MPRTISIKALLLSVVLSVLSLPSFAAQLSYSCSYYQPPQNGATSHSARGWVRAFSYGVRLLGRQSSAEFFHFSYLGLYGERMHKSI